MTKNRVPEFPYLLAEWLDQIPRQQRLTPIYLGGTGGGGGGAGQPPGGFIGKLPQRYIAYDTDQFALTSGSGSLVDNLNHIRYWEKSARWFEAHQGNPIQNRVLVEPGIWTHTANAQPLIFAGGYSPTFTSGSVAHVDVLYLNTSGSLVWSTSATTTPAYPGGTTLPIWEVYIRSSGNTYDTDQGTNNYLLRDVRPFLNLGSSGGSSGSLLGTPTRIPYFNTTSTLADSGQFALTYDTSGSVIIVIGDERNLSPELLQARLQIISNNPGAGFTSVSYNDNPTLAGFYTLVHAGGTRNSPTPALSGFSLGRTNFLGYTTSGSNGFGSTSARIETVAAENFTTGSQGSYITMQVTRPGTATLLETFKLEYDQLLITNARASDKAAIRVNQTDNTSGTSNAKAILSVGGASGGDPFIDFNVFGVSDVYFGVDNSDNDDFKLGTGTVVGSGVLTVVSVSTGQYRVPTTGSGAGILVGGDTQLYRASADLFRTPDSLTIDGGLNLGSASNAPAGQLRQSSGSQIWNGLILTAAAAGTLPVGTGSSGRVSYWSDTNTLTSNSVLTFDGVTLKSTLLLASGAAVADLITTTVSNSDNTDPASAARVYIAVGGISAGDPTVGFTVSGGTSWSAGIDNSDSDKFKIAASLSLGAADIFEITSGGQIQLDTQDTGGGVLIGTDALLYRGGTDTLRTPDSLIVDFGLNVGIFSGAPAGVVLTSGSIYSKASGIGGGFSSGSGGGIVQWYQSAADMWRTPDSVTIDGSLSISSTLSISTGAITSGTYNPTATSVTNCAATPTAYTANYIRVGNMVYVFGEADIDPTAVGLTTFRMSLPIASALTSFTQLAGTFGSATVAQSGTITADATNDAAQFDFVANNITILTHAYHYGYRIL